MQDDKLCDGEGRIINFKSPAGVYKRRCILCPVLKITMQLSISCVMSTHTAIVTASIRGALQAIQVPTVAPGQGEVLVKVEWTVSSPLELHRNDGGLLVKHPQVLGGGMAGTVVELGPGTMNLQAGDKASYLPPPHERPINLTCVPRSLDSPGESRKKAPIKNSPPSQNSSWQKYAAQSASTIGSVLRSLDNNRSQYASAPRKQSPCPKIL